VTARVHDPDGLASVTLQYRNDTSAPAVTNSVAMNDAGTGGDVRAGDGIYSATIAGQSANHTVAYHVEAGDSHASPATSKFPESVPVHECLVMFGQSDRDGTFPTYRFWMTEANRAHWTTRQKLSDAAIPGTLVYGGCRAVHEAGGRFRGSPFIRSAGNPETINMSFVLYANKDDELLGVRSFNLDRLEGDNCYQRERVSLWMADQIDCPFFHQRHVHVYINEHRKGTIYGDSQQPNDNYVASWWPNGNGGDLHKIDDWFEFDDAAQVHREFNENGQLRLYTTTGGIKKKARYRWSWRKENVQGLDDNYTNFFQMVDVMNMDHTSLEYAARAPAIIDYDEWMRTFAIEHIIRNWDSFGYNRGKNMSTYKPLNGRWKMIMWDLDHSHLTGSPTDNNLFSINCPTTRNKFFNHPPFRRAYWRAIQETADGPMRAENCDPVMDANYAALQANQVNVTSPDVELKQWVAERRAYLLSQLATVDALFEITTNSGNDFSSPNRIITLSGTAPVDVETLWINGAAHPVQFSNVNNWDAQVGLQPGANVITIEGRDSTGAVVVSDTITVTFTGQALSPDGLLVINEIMYNPSMPDAEFVELHNLSTTETIGLKGLRLNGLGFTFGSGAFIGPTGYVVVVESITVYASAYGNAEAAVGQYDGSLDNGGETLSLQVPAGTNVWTTIDRVTYDDSLPWPPQADGGGHSLQLIDPTKDNSLVGNWVTGGAVLCTPGQPNSVKQSLSGIPDITINEIQPRNAGTITDNAGDSDPWLEIYQGTSTFNNLNGFYLTDDPGTLDKWAFPANVAIGSPGFVLVWADGEPGEATPTDLHTSFRMNSDAGSLTLSWLHSGLTSVLDHVVYDGIATNRSYCRNPDGNVDAPWIVCYYATPGTTNNASGPPGPIRINEWMAKNDTTIADPADGQFEDWLEIHNSSTGAVDLSGYTLTDNMAVVDKWTFPSGAIVPAEGFLLVWADGETNQTGGGSYHADFALSSAGEDIAIFSPQRMLIDSHTFGPQTGDISRGRWPNGTGQTYSMGTPTPAASNIAASLVVTSPLGAPTPPNGTNVFDYNTPLTCSVAGSPNPSPGVYSECLGWTGTGSISASGTDTVVNVIMAVPSTISWEWSAQHYRLTVSAGAGGSVNTTGGWYSAGTTGIVVSASADPGYSFTGWSGDVAPAQTNQTSLTLTMDGPKDLVANFDPTLGIFTITASATSWGTISPTGAVQVLGLTDQSFSMYPNTGCELETLTVDGAPVAPVTTYTFSNVSANHTIHATFKRQAPGAIFTFK